MRVHTLAGFTLLGGPRGSSLGVTSYLTSSLLFPVTHRALPCAGCDCSGHLWARLPQVQGIFLPGHFVEGDTEPEGHLHGEMRFVRVNHHKCVLNAWMSEQVTSTHHLYRFYVRSGCVVLLKLLLEPLGGRRSGN